MPNHSSNILQLAKRGAEVRLRELAAEAKILFAAFPDLRKSFDRDELPVPFIIRQGARRAATKHSVRKRRMSPAARRAASERMKKYWAARKARLRNAR